MLGINDELANKPTTIYTGAKESLFETAATFCSNYVQLYQFDMLVQSQRFAFSM